MIMKALRVRLEKIFAERNDVNTIGASKAIGKGRAYIQQFIRYGKPNHLDFMLIVRLAEYLNMPVLELYPEAGSEERRLIGMMAEKEPARQEHVQLHTGITPDVLSIRLSEVSDVKPFCLAAIRLAELRDVLGGYRKWTELEREKRLDAAVKMAEELKKEEAKAWLESDSVIETLRLKAS